jgi:membrane protease YdiL (CAAX protease family)
MRKLFIASDGRLTLAWRILFALVVQVITLLIFFSIPSVLFSVLFHVKDTQDAFRPANYGDIRMQAPILLSAIFGLAATIGFTAWLRRKIDRRPWAGIALTKPGGHWREFGFGLLLGSGIVGIVIAIALATGMWTLRLAQVGWVTIVVAIAFGIANNLIVGIREEVVYRGYVFQNLGERMPLWLAAPLLSIIFVLLHGPGQFLILSWAIQALLLSAICICMRLVTGSLWFGIGFHSASDACSYIMYSLLLSALPNIGATVTILSTLEIPFFVLLFIVLLTWSVRKAHINWRGRLTNEGQPVATLPSMISTDVINPIIVK